MNTVPRDDEKLREKVRERYGSAALQVLETGDATSDGCCGTGSSCWGRSSSSCCGTVNENVVTSDLYSSTELGELPLAAALASLGCGNPTALAELKPGEKVLDLGSGGGIDVLLSARRVAPTGFAYGLDMTDAMLKLAEKNCVEAGVENVRFLKGVIEDIPLAASSVDVIISNCVINLSADKGQVLREAYRVLTSGGRFAVSDIVVQGDLPSTLRQDMESWAGCIAGALEEKTYRSLLDAAGFVDIDIEVTRRYSLAEIASSGASASVSLLSSEERQTVDGQFVSAFVRARKPQER